MFVPPVKFVSMPVSQSSPMRLDGQSAGMDSMPFTIAVTQ
jgi:hypothetical protein